MDVKLFFAAYWIKYVTAALFVIINFIVVKLHVDKKTKLFKDGILLFLVSPSFISVIDEFLTVNAYNSIVDNLPITDAKNTLWLIMTLSGDVMFVFLGAILYSQLTDMHNYKGATVYMEFVCIERLCLVLAISSFSYIVIFIIACAVFMFVFRNDADFIVNSENINFKHMLIYLIGLFYILDLLYGACYIFPELGTNIVNFENVAWLDMMAIISTAFAVGYMKVRIAEARALEEKLNYFKKAQRSQEDIIITLAEISEAKSGETGQHVRRVAEYSKLLASKLGLSYYEVENIKIAATMHDLGKLMIQPDILEKPGKLTNEEYEIVKEHSKYGWDILAKSGGDIIEMARLIALQHHERWNGKGYPDGIKGNDISIYAQIVAVADVFDALSSKRCYKEAWSVEEAKVEIFSQRGEQFAPDVVDVFLDSFDEFLEIKQQYGE